MSGNDNGTMDPFNLNHVLNGLEQTLEARREISLQAALITHEYREALSYSLPTDAIQQIYQGIQAVEEVAEHFREVQGVVEETIDLEDPWNYDSRDSQIDELAREKAVSWSVEFVNEVEELNNPYFEPLIKRFEVGLESYLGYSLDNRVSEIENFEDSIRPHEAIYIFISSQDALMHWLCDRDPSETPRNQGQPDEYYLSGQKKAVLANKYTEFFNIASSDNHFRDNLDAFYRHRNFIMHGNPGAHFDLNIATASLLFYALTLHTVLEEAS